MAVGEVVKLNDLVLFRVGRDKRQRRAGVVVCVNRGLGVCVVMRDGRRHRRKLVNVKPCGAV